MAIDERLDQLEKRNKLLTVGRMAMMVMSAIQFSACGKDPAGPSLTTCDVSEILAMPLGERDLTSCMNLAFSDLEGANLRNANLEGANLYKTYLEGAINTPLN